MSADVVIKSSRVKQALLYGTWKTKVQRTEGRGGEGELKCGSVDKRNSGEVAALIIIRGPSPYPLSGFFYSSST